jgi:hypothetical protein
MKAYIPGGFFEERVYGNRLKILTTQLLKTTLIIRRSSQRLDTLKPLGKRVTQEE